MENVVRIHQVEKMFGDRVALAGIDLEVESGTLCCLYGPAMAGKSTLLRILAGEIRPSRGKVEVMGVDPFYHRTTARSLLGFLPENPTFHEGMSVRGYLAFLGRAGGLGGSSLAHRLDETMQCCALGEPGQLVRSLTSEGFARLGLAQALLLGPPVLLLDDLASGLSGESRQRLEALLLSLRGDHAIIYSARSLGILLFHHSLASLRSRYKQPVIRFRPGSCPPPFLHSLRQQPWLEEMAEENDTIILRVHDLDRALIDLPKLIAAHGLPLYRLEVPQTTLPELLSQAGRDLASHV
jgi:ABC-type Na+ transport system ATPase subunit NatA